jgi:hypothetical protein
MFPPFQPLQLLLVIFAGWVNRRQLDVSASSMQTKAKFKHVTSCANWTNLSIAWLLSFDGLR